MNINKLIKILNLTQSDNDNEALVAIRKANKLLLSENKSWGDLIGEPSVTIKGWQPQHPPPASPMPPRPFEEARKSTETIFDDIWASMFTEDEPEPELTQSEAEILLDKCLENSLGLDALTAIIYKKSYDVYKSFSHTQKKNIKLMYERL